MFSSVIYDKKCSIQHSYNKVLININMHIIYINIYYIEKQIMYFHLYVYMYIRIYAKRYIRTYYILYIIVRKFEYEGKLLRRYVNMYKTYVYLCICTVLYVSSVKILITDSAKTTVYPFII